MRSPANYPTKTKLMSIAISAVLHPSKIARVCTITFALFLLLIGIYIGSLTTLPMLYQFALIATCCLAAWGSFLYSQKIAQASWCIHVDGQGKLRCQSIAKAGDVLKRNPLNIMAGTTLWTHALFLRLNNQEENIRINLVVLPDALSKDEFRRLSVACKWIVAHAEPGAN